MTTSLDIRFHCESCGYDVRGVALTENCPECGLPIRESLPAQHPGTPWQRDPGLVTLLVTIAIVMFRPRRAWQMIRMGAGDRGLGLWCIALAGVCAPMSVFVPVVASLAITAPEKVGLAFTSGVWLPLAIVPPILMGFEVLIVGMVVAFLAAPTLADPSAIRSTAMHHATCIWPGTLILATVIALAGSIIGTLISTREELIAAPLSLTVLMVAGCLATSWHAVWLWTGIRRLRHRNHPAAAR